MRWIDTTHNPFDESHWASCLRKPHEQPRMTQVPRQSLTRRFPTETLPIEMELTKRSDHSTSFGLRQCAPSNRKAGVLRGRIVADPYITNWFCTCGR
jgi:hypothetical protein